MPAYLKEDQENQTLEYQYRKDPMISGKEHCRQAKIAVFQELLHQEIHHGKL